jgi:mannosyl-3-phosphoglycerate phosphatase
VRPRPRLVIVTGVDGCMLDRSTHSHAASDPAVRQLALAGVPLVLCSSRTRVELERLQQELGLSGPFIAENGGALYSPIGALPFVIPGARQVAGHEVVEFGAPHRTVLATLLQTAVRVGVEITTFSGMSVQRVADECGLSLAQARLAKLREYDEPFRLVDPDPAAHARLWRALHNAGLRCSAGRRFDHVTGATDQGVPVAVLRKIYGRAFGDVELVGLGAAVTDVGLLKAVDLPIVVRCAGDDDAEVLVHEVRGAKVSKLEGPAGWCESVIDVLAARSVSANGSRSSRVR